jgi:glyoxylase-like metal-dependent hydrolase (beta-lactamase superfamily II)
MSTTAASAASGPAFEQRVGDIRILSVVDGYGVQDAREILVKPGTEGDPWLAHADLLNEAGQLEMTMGAYLVATGDRRVLVDAGVGMIDNDAFHGGVMLDSLAAVGCRPEDVTDVIFTHLHFDHVGWATRQGEVVFSNATYRCHAADWAYFIERDDAEAGAVRKLTPLTPQLELFDTDHTIAPGVDVRHAPGHTPGSVILVVSDGDDRAMLIGDIAHCTAELTEDEWEAVFDLDRDLARRTREALARELEGTDTPVAAAHFPGLRFGRLLSGQGQRSWVFG